MTFAETFQRAYKTTILDVILLGRAERVAATYPDSGRHKLREYFNVASRRAGAATDLLESQPAAAVVLFRDATVAYTGAILAARGEAVDLQSGDIKGAFQRLEEVRADLPAPPSEFDRARTLLTSDDPLALDRMSETEAAAAAQTVAGVVTWLHDAIEPRSVAEIRRSRWLRLVVLGVAALAFLVWGGVRVFSPTNIALHKRVTVSSTHPNSTAPDGGLTDGDTGGAYGVHTAAEDNPWVRVDLGDVYQLKKVKIYNRGDGWYDDSLPLALELSENGVDFTPVDRRTTSFSQWSPWVYAADGKKARYIQVHGTKGKFVALGELEAFGKK
jgi:hypothetical protein